MQIFILTAGLMFGWRAGLVVGLLTPLVSYAVSVCRCWPFYRKQTVELSVYGLAAGMLREKLNLGVVWSLLGAMVTGRLALLLAVLAVSLVSGGMNSPSVRSRVLSALSGRRQTGWPGIAFNRLSSHSPSGWSAILCQDVRETKRASTMAKSFNHQSSRRYLCRSC